MRNLGQLEALVMDRLWSAEGPLSVRQVLEGLPDDRHRAYTTVMTVLDNLFRKGLADREFEGRAYVYRPRQTREEHTATLMESVLKGGGDRGTALMHFVEQLQPDEAEQLRALLTHMDHPPNAPVRGRTGKRGRTGADPS